MELLILYSQPVNKLSEFNKRLNTEATAHRVFTAAF